MINLTKSKQQSLIKMHFQAGVSMVELMVALVIGLIVSLAVYTVLNNFEGRKRTTTSINDIDQAGTYATYQVDKMIRSAGSGFSAGIENDKAAALTFGCPLNAASGGSQILPATAAFPAPFASVSTAIRIAPVIILDGVAGTSGVGGDVIITMSGNSGGTELATDTTGATSTTDLNVNNNINFKASDIVLVTKPVTTTMTPCLIEQVNSVFTPSSGAITVPLSGNYYQATVNSVALSSFAAGSKVLNLGQSPAFEMFAVGANNTLLRYNLLQAQSTTTPNPSILAETVFQMHAIYGVDADANPKTPSLTWFAATGATYGSANLLSGSVAANAVLANIKAVKLAIITRSPLLEKPVPPATSVSPSSLVLFDGSGLPVVDRTVNITDVNYRYRVTETTIPIRNSLMLEDYNFFR
jgi:type IV pilus assembly protein PilW